ncbi:hypothetical protein FRC01_007627 [Tulasnella sp. 417]|nr:hypothetical protein FRC01_007627 [Tulasnella sp. 417]
MFSRSQSYSKRTGQPSAAGIGNAPAANSKLLKSRPSLDTATASFSVASTAGPSLAFSPVNVQSRPNAAPDNLHARRSTFTDSSSSNSISGPAVSQIPNPTTPSSSHSALPMLPSIRSIRSRFPFGSRSSSQKKERSVSTAVDIIVGEEDVLEIGSGGHVGDRSLDPAALRPSSPTKPTPSPGLLAPQLSESVTLPRMHSQPNLGNKKRKSFDLAALSGRPTALPIGVAKVPPTDLGIGLGRPPFVPTRLNGGRTFTPNGTAIREVLSEGEIDDGEVIDVRAKTPVERKSAALEPKAQIYSPEPSNLSQPALPDLDTTPRRSSSMDSNGSANVTRVVDLSFNGPTSSAAHPSTPTSPVTQYSPESQSMQGKSPSGERDIQSLLQALEMSTDSKRADQGHSTPVLVSGGDAQWSLNDMKGAVTRMRTMANDGRSSPISSATPSPTIPPKRLSLILQSSSEPNLLQPAPPVTRSGFSTHTHAPSPLATEFVVPSSSPKSKPAPGPSRSDLSEVQLGLLSPETIAPETSYHIDVEAMEMALEDKLGREFVGGILEDDESIMESRKTAPPAVERSFSAPAATGTLSVIADDENEESKMSLNLGSLDPNLAALLSPNNLLSLGSSSTPTKAKVATPMARQALTLTLNSATSPRFHISAEDVTLSASGGRPRSSSLATSVTTPALSVGHSPLSAPGVITPASDGPPSVSGSSIRSRTPTPQRDNDDPMLLTPTKRHSVSSTRTTSTASGVTSLVNASPAYSASSVATSRASRKGPPLLPVVIPDPLPPRKTSPEDAVFSHTRRMTVTSAGAGPSALPPSPGPRKRTISVEARSPSKGLAASTNAGPRRYGLAARRVLEDGVSPNRAMSPTLGRTRTAMDHYSNTGRASVDLERMRDGAAYQRPSTSIAHHRRLRTESPERGSRPSPRAGREEVDQTQTLPPRANTSFSFNRNVAARANRDQEPSPRDVNGPPMHSLRKRRSYSIDVSGDRSRIFATLGQKGHRDEDAFEDDFGSIRPNGRSWLEVSAASSTPNLAARLDSMGPLTKRAFAAAGLLGSDSNAAGSGSRLGASTSKVYGGGDWKESRQQSQTPDDTMRPTLSRASTLADMAPATSRHQSKDSVSTAEHPSTPSSTSGPSRTLYAPSTTSSGPGNSGGRASPSPVHGGGYLPTITVSSHTETVTMLKERHEVEKEALVSALADMKRENQRVTKERDDLAAYVSELEERLARAEELNRKMEGLRMAVMEVAGGIGPSDSASMRSSMRRVPGISPARTASTLKPGLRPRADSDQLRASHLSRRPPPVETGHLYPTGMSMGRPQRDLNRRSATSEVSSLMPSIPNPRDMQMLFHEHPPSHYAPSSIAESEDSRPSSPVLPAHLTLGKQSASPSAPSFSFYHADDAASSDGGSLKLCLEDELHLADLVSMGPASDDESESVF